MPFLISDHRRTDGSRIFFPFGALTVRLLSFQGLVWVHVGAQTFAYLLALVALGLGVWIAVSPSSQVRSPLTVSFTRKYMKTVRHAGLMSLTRS